MLFLGVKVHAAAPRGWKTCKCIWLHLNWINKSREWYIFSYLSAKEKLLPLQCFFYLEIGWNANHISFRPPFCYTEVYAHYNYITNSSSLRKVVNKTYIKQATPAVANIYMMNPLSKTPFKYCKDNESFY